MSTTSTAGSETAKPIAYDSAMRALHQAMARREIDAEVEELPMHRYRVKYAIKDKPLITIIIPARTTKYIGKCVRSILNKTSYHEYEILIVNRTGLDLLTMLQHSRKIKVITDSTDFNFSHINNQAAKVARGDYLVFLNDDTEALSNEWLSAMLEHAQHEEIGAVGAKLLRPNGAVQHAGIIVGIEGFATNYGGMAASDPGYFRLVNMIRNCAAVTGACMMVRKSYFLEIGGFDEELGHSWNDVDFGIRVLQSRRRVVYTPFAVLYHHVGGTRGALDASPQEIKAKTFFREKNIDFIRRGDPFYNTNLSTQLPYKPRFVGTISTKGDVGLRGVMSDPEAVLRYIYDRRPDLRSAFPEAAKGDYSRLMSWASNVTIESDSEALLLLKHKGYYASRAAECS